MLDQTIFSTFIKVDKSVQGYPNNLTNRQGVNNYE